MEAFYKTYKPALRSFYKLLCLAILVLVLACVASYLKAGEAWLKWVWIAAVTVDVLILLYIFVQRKTMSLILRDNPEKAEDQEVAFIRCHPLKPFSPDFRESIEIGLANVVHTKVRQTMMQTILRIGDVVITSSGTGSEEIQAHNLPDPGAVRDEIQLHARKYTMPAGAAPSSTEA
ncbi:MAG: PH domain-containing protein [Synergistaceae bacterium]|nr:PH domain-containing protein [Synergistaceae bacterium]